MFRQLMYVFIRAEYYLMLSSKHFFFFLKVSFTKTNKNDDNELLFIVDQHYRDHHHGYYHEIHDLDHNHHAKELIIKYFIVVPQKIKLTNSGGRADPGPTSPCLSYPARRYSCRP